MGAKKNIVVELSKWNNIGNVATLSNAIDGAIIRCGFRGNSTSRIIKDAKFDLYAKSLYDLGNNIGVYFLTNAISEHEARSEAEFTVEMIKRLKIELSFPIFVASRWCNSSHNALSDSLTPIQRSEILLSWIDQCNIMGYKAGIFATKEWFNVNLNPTFVDYTDKWIEGPYDNLDGLNNVIGAFDTATMLPGMTNKININDWTGVIARNAHLISITNETLDLEDPMNVPEEVIEEPVPTPPTSTKLPPQPIPEEQRNIPLEVEGEEDTTEEVKFISEDVVKEEDDGKLVPGKIIKVKRDTFLYAKSSVNQEPIKALSGQFAIWEKSNVMNKRIRISMIGETELLGWIDLENIV